MPSDVANTSFNVPILDVVMIAFDDYDHVSAVLDGPFMTNHVYNSMVNVMSKTVWDSMSEEQQKIVKEEFVAAGNYMRELMIADADELIKKLEEEGYDR